MGSKLLGWSIACAVEIDPFARSVLLRRQAEGHLDRFPIWDDVSTFDGNPWSGSIDVISGGFPCQDISVAGKRKGIAGDRSALVYEMLRIVEEVRPRFVFAENSPRLRSAGLGAIVSTLASMGYDCAWGVLGAWHSGAPHKRNRMWLLAHADGEQLRQQSRRRQRKSRESSTEPMVASGAVWRQAKPSIHRVHDGMAGGVDELRAIGNGQVPQVAALAFQVLSEALGV